MEQVLEETVPDISGELCGGLNMQVDELNLEESNKLLVERSSLTRPGELLHHCLPITNLKLLEGIVLAASEGPSILLKMAYFDKQSFSRYQIFPSQLIISGMELVSYPTLECGENPVLWHRKRDKPYDHIYVGFVWAGSVGTVIRVTRSSKGSLKILEGEGRRKADGDIGDLMTLEFIPVAAKWLEGGNVLALLSVLNYVVLYERVESGPGAFTGLRELARIKCDKSETLFSGAISGSSRGDIRIFAGTVFNGICVWDVNGDQGIIRHELKCHNGIVFSLEYYSDRKILLSTSDDRTVAVWQFSELMDKEEEQVSLLHRFYGHEARVWKALLVHGYIISVGESSEIRVNSLKDGSEHKSWRGHDGGPIFTCAYDADVDILYTGGGEGSIRKWPKWWYRLQPRILPYDVIPFDPDTEDKNRIQGSGRWAMNKDFPKMVLLLDINHALASMESGRVVGMTWEGKQFDLLHDSQCEGYQIIKLSPDHKVLAVAGKDGHFYTAEIAFSENQSSKTTVLYARKLFMTKISWNILSMIWLDKFRLLIICFNRAVALFFEENEKGERSEAKLVQVFNLNLQRPGVPAAVEIFGKHIVLGDEFGTLHVFRYHKTNEVICKFENAHKDGITDLLFHDSVLYSTGRDGLVRTYSKKVNADDDLQVELIPDASFRMPFDWIAGIYVNMGQMLACGFQKEDFVVHNLNEKRTLAKIPCGGGGNRKWDFKYGHGLEGSINASFAFVKEKEILYTFLPMTGHLYVIMREGLHSRTINCALILPSRRTDKETINYITGSEDGSLKWFEWDRFSRKILSVENMENHVSSVRSAWKITDVSNQTFIFTGGGRSQLCIYKIDFDNRRMDLLKEIILVKTTCRQTEGDVRIMDIAVIEASNSELLCFGACSDGFVRVLYFNTHTLKFKIAGALCGSGHAVMRIQLLKTEDSSDDILVCGVTSNGYFSVWSWKINDMSVASPPVSNRQTLPEKQPTFITLLRRTAFMSMKIICGSEQSTYSVVCGGDDCSVSLWSLQIRKDVNSIKFTVKEKWTRDQSQRGAVVGVFMEDERIFTISNDQIVGFWNVNGDLERTTYAGVSDCQGFVTDGENRCILCFGKGVSWIPS